MNTPRLKLAHPLARAIAATLLSAVALCAAAAPDTTATPAATTTSATLQATLEALQRRALPATLGVAVIDVQSGASWGVASERPFPMMSDFKAPVAAAILARIDAGTLTLDHTVTLTRADIAPGSAVPSIGSKFTGERMRFTVAELLRAAVTDSDNTAVDALLKLLGGPGQLTAYLRGKGIEKMVATVDEHGLAAMTNERRAAAARPLLPRQTAALRHAALMALGSPNTTTPAASALFVRKLWAGEMISPASSAHLLDLMYAQTIPNRLRRGLPNGARLADKTGTSGAIDGTASYNDMGLFTWPNGRAVIVTVCLTDTAATQQQMETLFGDIGRAATEALAPAPAAVK